MELNNNLDGIWKFGGIKNPTCIQIPKKMNLNCEVSQPLEGVFRDHRNTQHCLHIIISGDLGRCSKCSAVRKSCKQSYLAVPALVDEFLHLVKMRFQPVPDHTRISSCLDIEELRR